MVAVGHDDLGGRGFNADVWVHEQYAYVGSWGFSDWAAKQRFCPNDGVAVVDTRNPSRPREVATLRARPARRPRTWWSRRLATARSPGVTSPWWASRCAVATARTRASSAGCRSSTSPTRGIRPSSPGWDTGCCTRGLHELEVEHRDDLQRTFVYASVPTSEYADALGRRDRMGRGDFRLIDITNPRLPVEVSDWGVHRNLGGAAAPGLGCDPDAEYGHSAEPSADGRLAFMSYWDSGFIALDVTDPDQADDAGPDDLPGDRRRRRALLQLRRGPRPALQRRRGLLQDLGLGHREGLRLPARVGLSWISGRRADRQVRDGQRHREQGPQGGRHTIHNPLLSGRRSSSPGTPTASAVVDASDPPDRARSRTSFRRR